MQSRCASHEVKRHEHAVWVGHVVGEGWTLGKAVAPVKRTRGQKVLPRPGLEAQARHAVSSRSCNDVVQYRTARSLPAHGLGYVHRLDLAVLLRQAFERPEPQERLIVPDRPETDVGRLQAADVQRVRTSGRRLCSGRAQMDMQEAGNAWVAQVALDEAHHRVGISQLLAIVFTSYRACGPVPPPAAPIAAIDARGPGTKPWSRGL